MATTSHDEEFFGILTDDQLYLDCTLFRPPGVPDDALLGIRVWVPKYPLSKNTVMTCARQEVIAAGAKGRVAHLIFDLRGTGNSDFKDNNYANDISAIRLWAAERFGQISLGFFGTPSLTKGRVDLTPVRTGVIFEQYVFQARGIPSPRTVVYLATYGNFSTHDEAICLGLSRAGYQVHAMDPLRYLLHASHAGRLKTDDLWTDFVNLGRTLMGTPIIVAQPVSAGLGLMLAAGTDLIQGVVAIGRAQAAFVPSHIFDNDNPQTFFISRYINRIAPRPVALVVDSRCRREDLEELATLHQMSGEPRRLEKTRVVTLAKLEELLRWIEVSVG